VSARGNSRVCVHVCLTAWGRHQAKRLKVVETELQQMGTHIAKLMELKAAAVEAEDYDACVLPLAFRSSLACSVLWCGARAFCCHITMWLLQCS
jgi:hypothetical protein